MLLCLEDKYFYVWGKDLLFLTQRAEVLALSAKCSCGPGTPYNHTYITTLIPCSQWQREIIK